MLVCQQLLPVFIVLILLSTHIGQSQGQGSPCPSSRMWVEVNNGASENAPRHLQTKFPRPLMKPHRFKFTVFPFGIRSQPRIHWASWITPKPVQDCFFFLASGCPTILVLPRVHDHRANRIRVVAAWNILLFKCIENIKIEKIGSFVSGTDTSG